MEESKYGIGTYIKVDWTDAILKITGEPRFKEEDESYWYDCDTSDFNREESSYYCNTAQYDIIEIATEKEFYARRKETFEAEIEYYKNAIAACEREIAKIRQMYIN